MVEADDLFLQVVDVFFIVEGFDSFLNPSVGVVSVVSFGEAGVQVGVSIERGGLLVSELQVGAFVGGASLGRAAFDDA